jgi:CheY-like chemotaxis protein
MPQATTILVVDDDEWSVRMVSSLLSARGYRIATASDGQEGLIRARQVHPDLIISDVVMPDMDGWALLKHLRADPVFAFTPVIFLTGLNTNDDRIKGLKLGVDDYLAKPFHVEELELRVANVLRRSTRGKTVSEQTRNMKADDGVGVRGHLEQVGLTSILSMLAMERKSGVLVVSQRDPETQKERIGRMFMAQGNVIQAKIDGVGGMKNQEAVFEIVSWTEGVFEFAVLEVEMEDKVQSSTVHLLLEAARRLDEELNKAAEGKSGPLGLAKVAGELEALDKLGDDSI